MGSSSTEDKASKQYSTFQVILQRKSVQAGGLFISSHILLCGNNDPEVKGGYSKITNSYSCNEEVRAALRWS